MSLWSASRNILCADDFTFPGKSPEHVFGILVEMKVLHFDSFIRKKRHQYLKYIKSQTKKSLVTKKFAAHGVSHYAWSLEILSVFAQEENFVPNKITYQLII
jgi:hypothetical protein